MPGRYLRRKKHNWWLITLLSVLVVVDTLLVVLLICLRNAPTEEVLPTESVTQAIETAPPTEAETEPLPTEQNQSTETELTEETEEQTTEPAAIPQQPSLLTELLEKGGVTCEELELNGCSQLVTVVSSGTTAQIRFFSSQEGTWEELPELYCQGRVGWNGVGADKQEGDGCTPSGLFGIGSAFYIDDMPDTGLDVFQITDETYWVDDPNSAFYNQRVEGTQNKDWNSAEYMISYDVYRYGFVVEYNLQAVKNAGSAIFFHVGDNSTAGCVATGENMVLAYLKELDGERNPHILIICGDDT